MYVFICHSFIINNDAFNDVTLILRVIVKFHVLAITYRIFQSMTPCGLLPIYKGQVLFTSYIYSLFTHIPITHDCYCYLRRFYVIIYLDLYIWVPTCFSPGTKEWAVNTLFIHNLWQRIILMFLPFIYFIIHSSWCNKTRMLSRKLRATKGNKKLAECELVVWCMVCAIFEICSC